MGNNGFSWMALIIHAAPHQNPVSGLRACRLKSGSSCVQRSVEVGVPLLIHSPIFPVQNLLPHCRTASWLEVVCPEATDVWASMYELFEENCFWERLIPNNKVGQKYALGWLESVGIVRNRSFLGELWGRLNRGRGHTWDCTQIETLFSERRETNFQFCILIHDSVI